MSRNAAAVQELSGSASWEALETAYSWFPGNGSSADDLADKTYRYWSGQTKMHHLQSVLQLMVAIRSVQRGFERAPDMSAVQSATHRLMDTYGDVRYDSSNNICGLYGYVHDITEQKKAEKEIKRQLEEKEILLKEVHHRLKNNITSIQSLLEMQLFGIS